MKNLIVTAAFVMAVMLLVPLGALTTKSAAQQTIAPSKNQSASIPKNPTFYDSFRVKNADTGEITVMDAKGYIFGVVAAEMPALYEVEALKAQAVAAYTYACKRADERKGEDYDITTNSKIDQSYISIEKASDLWGDSADQYVTKIKQAVSAVSDMLLCYEGACALSVYHAISSGNTNACSDVWGKEIPYLVSVSSLGDKTAQNYLDNPIFTPAELAGKLKGVVTLSGDESKYIKDIKKTENGLVKSLSVCDKALTGSELAAALELRSASFDVEFKNGAYSFTVYGYGHGVGMSQNGANYMAKQGSDFKEILMHYYKGCQIAVRNKE